MNIGSASMLLIFVILCLVSFAALSIASANADRQLTDKITDRTNAYYAACGSAEESLAGIDRVLAAQYLTSPDEASYFEAVGRSKSYAIPISGSQILYVAIEILYPETAEDTYYRITNWQVITE